MKSLFILTLLIGNVAFPVGFKNEINALNVGNLKTPEGQSLEKTYAVQNRANRLQSRVEAAVSGARNVNAGAFVNSQEIGLNLKYHFSDRVFVSLYGASVSNSLSDAGERLWKQEEVFPDISSVKKRGDLQIGYNTFYGKFRLTMDTLFYFDQYFTLGGGAAELFNGIDSVTAPAIVAGTGLSVWVTSRWNATIGVKDHYVNEYRRLGRGWVHHILVNISVGLLFGGGDRV